MKIAVVGAHLSGQPLNSQLAERNARLLRVTRTASIYRLFALANTTPAKPGLLRVADATVNGIEVEVWELGPAEFGTFMELVSAPLCIGTLELEDGERVKGFLVESYAVVGAKEITNLGGWRAYLETLKPAK